MTSNRILLPSRNYANSQLQRCHGQITSKKQSHFSLQLGSPCQSKAVSVLHQTAYCIYIWRLDNSTITVNLNSTSCATDSSANHMTSAPIPANTGWISISCFSFTQMTKVLCNPGGTKTNSPNTAISIDINSDGQISYMPLHKAEQQCSST